jgi:hypothetical protein
MPDLSTVRATNSPARAILIFYTFILLHKNLFWANLVQDEHASLLPGFGMFFYRDMYRLSLVVGLLGPVVIGSA